MLVFMLLKFSIESSNVELNPVMDYEEKEDTCGYGISYFVFKTNRKSSKKDSRFSLICTITGYVMHGFRM